MRAEQSRAEQSRAEQSGSGGGGRLSAALTSFANLSSIGMKTSFLTCSGTAWHTATRLSTQPFLTPQMMSLLRRT